MTHTKPLVYVAGPYTHPDPVHNTNRAINFAEWLEDNFDVGVVIPHLSLAWHLVRPAPVDVWYARDLHLLERCDAVFRFAGESTGADREVHHARALDIVCFGDQSSIVDIRLWRDQWVSR